MKKYAKGSSCLEQGYPEYPYVSNFVMFIFCGYVVTWYLQIGSRIELLGAVRFEFILACVLSVLIFTTRTKKRVKIETPLLTVVVIWFLLLFVMTVFSYDFSHSWNIFFNRIVKFAFMAIFITCFVNSPKGLRFFIAAFMLACMKMGQEGLAGQVTGSLVWQNQGVMKLHGATLMYRHPNSFSGMALGTLPFVLYLFPISNRFCKSLLLIQLFFALNIILHTGSRTGYIGLIGMSLVVLFTSRHKIRILFILLACFVCILNFAPEQYIDRFRSIYDTPITNNYSSYSSQSALHGGDSSKLKRIQILKDARDIFMMHPFGVGVSAFPSIRKDVFNRYQDTHNLYLEVATNIGIQGLIVFSALIYYLIKSMANCSKQITNEINILKNNEEYFIDNPLESNYLSHCKDLKFIKAICSSVILFICLRLFLGLFGMDLYEIYWWFSIGVAFSVMTIYKVSRLRTQYLINNLSGTLALS